MAERFMFLTRKRVNVCYSPEAVIAAALFLLSLILGCGGEDPLLRKKLDVILKDDLVAIVEGVEAEGVMATPLYRVDSFSVFPEGTYSAKAVVEFEFLKNVPVKVVRKYRYHRMMGKWDRYYNKYQFENKAESDTLASQVGTVK